MAAQPSGAGMFGAIQAQLDSLSARDRKLLAGLVLFFGLIAVVFLGFTARSQLNDKAERVSDQKRSLAALAVQKDAYEAAMAAIEASETAAAGFKGQTLSGFIEKTAVQLGVRDELSITRQGTETISEIEVTRYKCELKRVTYENALSFIYELEASGFPLSIDTTRLNASRVKGEVMISVTLEISEFQLGGGT